MYYSRKWEIASGMLTIILATFAVVVPVPESNGWWWRAIVIVIALAGILALWRGLMLQSIARPHPLRVKVEKFICDLSEAKDVNGLGVRASELLYAFQKEGMYPARFRLTNSHPSLGELNQAAVCFQAMLRSLPY